MSAKSTSDSYTVHRNYTLGGIVFPPDTYPELRNFFSKIENKDQETVVLTTAKATPAGN